MNLRILREGIQHILCPGIGVFLRSPRRIKQYQNTNLSFLVVGKRYFLPYEVVPFQVGKLNPPEGPAICLWPNIKHPKKGLYTRL